MPLTTRCRHCGRLFPVYATELKANRGRVHCPQCGKRFDAVAGLIDEHIPQTEEASRRRHPAHRGVTAGLAPPGPNELPVPHGHGLGRQLWGFGVVLLTLALLGQAAWWERGELLRHRQIQSLVTETCELFGCRMPLPRLPGTIEILQATLAPDPDHDQGLTLDLMLVSRAASRQRAPLLELELFDAAGDLLAVRRFDPQAYLGPGSPVLSEGLLPRRPVQASLNLTVTEAQPTGFRVRLL